MNYERVKVEQQGSLLIVKKKRWETAQPQSYNTRGNITTFSRKSRMRMLEMFSRLDKKRVVRKKVLFITLTYQWRMIDFDRAKRDLKVFLERIQEKFPQAWIVWKMEQQKSGSIHFHITLGNVGFWKVQDAQDAWNEVTGQSAKNSLDLKPVKSVKRLMSYVSKYMAKTADERLNEITQKFMPMIACAIATNAGCCEAFLLGLSLLHIFSHDVERTGRYWGVWGRKNMPYAPIAEVTVNCTLYGWLTAVNAMHSKYARWWQSWRLFAPNAKMLFARFVAVATGTARHGFADNWYRWKLESIKQHMHRQWDDIFTEYKNRAEKERERLLFLVWAAKSGRLAEFGYSEKFALWLET